MRPRMKLGRQRSLGEVLLGAEGVLQGLPQLGQKELPLGTSFPQFLQIMVFYFLSLCTRSIRPHYTQNIEYSQGGNYVKIQMVIKMISYKPFYETLFRKGITEYNLIFKQGFSANTLHRMKKGEAISTKTLDALCYALDCGVEDIIKFERE